MDMVEQMQDPPTSDDELVKENNRRIAEEIIRENDLKIKNEVLKQQAEEQKLLLPQLDKLKKVAPQLVFQNIAPQPVQEQVRVQVFENLVKNKENEIKVASKEPGKYVIGGGLSRLKKNYAFTEDQDYKVMQQQQSAKEQWESIVAKEQIQQQQQPLIQQIQEQPAAVFNIQQVQQQPVYQEQLIQKQMEMEMVQPATQQQKIVKQAIQEVRMEEPILEKIQVKQPIEQIYMKQPAAAVLSKEEEEKIKWDQDAAAAKIQYDIEQSRWEAGREARQQQEQEAERIRQENVYTQQQNSIFNVQPVEDIFAQQHSFIPPLPQLDQNYAPPQQENVQYEEIQYQPVDYEAEIQNVAEIGYMPTLLNGSLGNGYPVAPIYHSRIAVPMTQEQQAVLSRQLEQASVMELCHEIIASMRDGFTQEHGDIAFVMRVLQYRAKQEQDVQTTGEILKELITQIEYEFPGPQTVRVREGIVQILYEIGVINESVVRQFQQSTSVDLKIANQVEPVIATMDLSNTDKEILWKGITGKEEESNHSYARNNVNNISDLQSSGRYTRQMQEMQRHYGYKPSALRDKATASAYGGNQNKSKNWLSAYAKKFDYNTQMQSVGSSSQETSEFLESVYDGQLTYSKNIQIDPKAAALQVGQLSNLDLYNASQNVTNTALDSLAKTYKNKGQVYQERDNIVNQTTLAQQEYMKIIKRTDLSVEAKLKMLSESTYGMMLAEVDSRESNVNNAPRLEGLQMALPKIVNSTISAGSYVAPILTGSIQHLKSTTKTALSKIYEGIALITTIKNTSGAAKNATTINQFSPYAVFAGDYKYNPLHIIVTKGTAVPNWAINQVKQQQDQTVHLQRAEQDLIKYNSVSIFTPEQQAKLRQLEVAKDQLAYSSAVNQQKRKAELQKLEDAQVANLIAKIKESTRLKSLILDRTDIIEELADTGKSLTKIKDAINQTVDLYMAKEEEVKQVAADMRVKIDNIYLINKSPEEKKAKFDYEKLRTMSKADYRNQVNKDVVAVYEPIIKSLVETESKALDMKMQIEQQLMPLEELPAFQELQKIDSFKFTLQYVKQQLAQDALTDDEVEMQEVAPELYTVGPKEGRMVKYKGKRKRVTTGAIPAISGKNKQQFSGEGVDRMINNSEEELLNSMRPQRQRIQ